jgi:membrane-associated phospholipid phosphatase
MHLGVHYPSDVLAGAVVGAGSAFLSYKLNRWITGKYSKKKTNKKML